MLVSLNLLRKRDWEDVKLIVFQISWSTFLKKFWPNAMLASSSESLYSAITFQGSVYETF